MNQSRGQIPYPLFRLQRDDCASIAPWRWLPIPSSASSQSNRCFRRAIWHGSPTKTRTGANIYVSANPLIPGSRKRTKEFVASVRHLYIDIDTDGEARLAALRASDRVPSPNAILSTSPGKYQALWRVAGFDFDSQEQMLKSACHCLWRRSGLH